MKLFTYTTVIAFTVIISLLSVSSYAQDGVLSKRVPVSTVPASSLDFTKVKDNTGNVSLPIPLVSLGGEDVQLKYYSGDVSNKVRTENQYAPSGEVGLGWQLLYGSISGEINNSADTSDDRYYYNGPDGSFQLQEDSTGVFHIPNYKAWRIVRKMDGNTIVGWEITKEDGTILRFGNYDKSTKAFSTAYSPTYATRFYLGYDGLVGNPGSSLYDSLSYIPYEWDLSNIQDVGGDQTTLIYQQVQFPIKDDGTSSTMKYTRESHLSQILDNKGQEIDFNYSAMGSSEYYDDYSSYDQNLVDTLYLNNISIKGNSTLYKKISFSYQSSDILSLGITKRYLTAFTFKDASGDSLPSYSFEYYGLGGISEGNTPGVLKNITDPQGGTVTYNFQTQSLDSVNLAKADTVSKIKYYQTSDLNGALIPVNDGLAGKDFIISHSQDKTLRVYRQGSEGWYQDMSFPYLTASYIRICNDYVILYDDTTHIAKLVRRINTGWKSYDITDAINQVTDSSVVTGGVVGVGQNYFVVKYWTINVEAPNADVAIIMINPMGIKAKPFGAVYRDDFDSEPGTPSASMRAFCGENYMILESDSSGYPIFSHFIFSDITQEWGKVTQDHYPQPNYLSNGNVNIGKNFILCMYPYGTSNSTSGELKVYRRSGTNLELIKNNDIAFNNQSYIVVGDDYYAYTGTESGSTSETAYLMTWNPNTDTFDSTDFSTLYPGFYGGNLTLIPLDNKLIVSWTASLYGDARITTYTTFTPVTRSWSRAVLIDSTSEPTDECVSLGMSLNKTTFAQMTYLLNYNSLYSPSNPPPPVPVNVYEFQGDSIKSTAIDSFPLKYVGTYDGYPYNEYQNPKYWILQPGNNLLGLNRVGGPIGGDIFSPDTVNMFTFTDKSDGSLQFTGAPTVPVLYQRIEKDGMGDSSVYTYSYNNGVMNEYQTPEYKDVIETQPGSNGNTESYYYVDLDSSANGLNYRDLEGMVYKTKESNSGGSVVKETDNKWNAVGVDPSNGVYDSQLLEDSTITDGVSSVTSYQYEDAAHAFMMNKKTETNSDGSIRRTMMKYPLDYVNNTESSGTNIKAIDSMRTSRHMYNEVMEKYTTEQKPDSSEEVISGELTEYSIFNSSQILPWERYEFDSPSKILLADYTVSMDTGRFFTKDSHYALKESYDSYDDYGNLLQNTDANSNHTSYEYGYDNSAQTVEAKNAASSEINYNSFEDSTIGGWKASVSGAGGISTDPYTGKFSYDENGSQYSYIYKTVYASDINTSGKYVISGWVKTSSANQPILEWSVRYGGSHAYPNPVQSPGGTNDWQFLEDTLTLSRYSGIDSIYIIATNGGTSSHADSKWDDFRFYPAGAQMTTTTYDPASLQISSEEGANSNPTYYTYDGFQRLNSVYNGEDSLLSKNLYYLAGDDISSSNPSYTTTFKYTGSADSLTSSQLFDGLGRTIQTLAKTSTSSHIVTDKIYDSMGRDSIDYKPFDNTGAYAYLYHSYILSDAENYYNSNVYDGFSDSYPYTKLEYYSDPLGRIKEEIPPGSPWQTHPVKYYYGDNGSSEVSGYSAGTLYKTTTTDENGNKTIEFKDKFGYIVETKTDSGGLNLTTAFTHDLIGNLTQTVPPDTSVNPTTYTYNTLGEMTEKTSPDAGTVQYKYDENGNLRLIQDANHYATSINTVSEDDEAIGNETINGSFELKDKGKVTYGIPDTFIPSGGSITVDIKTTGDLVLASITAPPSIHQSYTSTIILPKGSYHYSIISVGDATDGEYEVSCTQNMLFVYNKYDSQNRITETGEYYSGSLSDFSSSNADNTSFPTSNKLVLKKYFYDTPTTDALATGQENLHGKLSYTESYNNNGTLIERTCYSYDDMGRVEWVVQSNLTSSGKKVVYNYDLQGDITSVEYEDLDDNSPGDFYTNYTYDKDGRMTSTATDNSIDGSKTMADYEYFATGKAKQLETGVSDAPATIKYRYNERDWMTADSTTKFWEHIGYDSVAEAGQAQAASPQYNGNISWNSYYMYGVTYTDPVFHDSTNTIGYAYTYDNSNRLTAAKLGWKYGSSWTFTYGGTYNVPTISYDDNGNLTTLKRYGSGTTEIDDLSYHYRPNTDIDTLITNSVGTGATYTYDGNGNMLSDSRDSIAFIIYNIDNLPLTVYKTGGTVINYSYDVDGNRIRKVIGSTYTYYVRGKDGETDAIIPAQTSTNEVYNILGNGEDNIAQQQWDFRFGFTYYYYLKDHLGSIKMILNSSGGVDSYNDYYPYGMQMPGRNSTADADGRYKFTSKELDAETNDYYFGKRYYDGWKGQWGQVDPLEDNYPGWSPYNYVEDNPITGIDPNGMQDGGGGILGWLSGLFGNNSSKQTDPGTEATRAVVENIKEMNKKIDETPKKAVKATEKFADVVSKTSTVGAVAGVVVTGVGVVTADPVVAAAGVDITADALTVKTTAEVTKTVTESVDVVAFNGSKSELLNQTEKLGLNILSEGAVNSLTSKFVLRTGVNNELFNYTAKAVSDATKIIIGQGL
jgi:RHS repeat-associated protein